MTTFQFLTGDDRFRIDLPQHFSLREVRTVLASGNHWRALTYRTDSSDNPLGRPEVQLVRSLVSKRGLPITICEDTEPPPVRFLIWHTREGLVQTYFGAAEQAALDEVLTHVTVDDASIPRVSYGPPFRPGDVREGDQRDEAMFVRGELGQEHVVTVSRLPAGRWRPAEASPETAPGWVVHTARTPLGLKIAWGGPVTASAEIEGGMSRAVRSLRRVP
jgi:hypothetical protein